MISKLHMACLTPSRHNITSSSVASVEKVQMFLKTLLMITPHDYQTSVLAFDLKDSFNVDESGLFYHQIKAKSPIIAGDPCKGGKVQKNKQCITMIFGCSAKGEKLKMTVIRRSVCPYSFRSKEDILPIHYCYNQKGWTTAIEFEAYLSWLNKVIAQDCHVLLSIDNVPGHPDIQLSNIKLEFLPPNKTSKLQALDAGIIAGVKALYKKYTLNNILLNIKNSIKAAGLHSQPHAADITVPDLEKGVTDEM